MGVREAVTGLLFDFDGTIADTAQIWRQVTRRCFAARGFELDDRTLSRVLVSEWREVLPALSDADAVALENELVGSIHSAYLECPPTRGFEHFVEQFSDIPKAIVTSSYRERLVVPYLRRHGLNHHFSVVVGSEDTTYLKPSPEPILLALRLLNASPRGAWMIGDSPADVMAARSAGIRSAGFGDPTIGGDIVANSFQALARLLGAVGAEDEHRTQ
ncbi:MAG TPA: HAD-IA family hydrolase [Actinophytocola sp.]|uniref:HAD family hydrolase n=1 Tax=Actinophytocola sp. TaxID=1872138 RepID=UPI002DDD0F5A|nr:HAD-IA family hydrolase [Actinophytocola sp.]HEV2778204.1 HAD-IA family hydrolase [Actinophytocola sp.]